MAVKDTVENTIAEYDITIFSKSYCPFCRRAKSLLSDKYGADKLKVLELDEVEDGSKIQDYLLEKTGQRTVPNIFINQEHIGGCDAVVALQSSGKLPVVPKVEVL